MEVVVACFFAYAYIQTKKVIFYIESIVSFRGIFVFRKHYSNRSK